MDTLENRAFVFYPFSFAPSHANGQSHGAQLSNSYRSWIDRLTRPVRGSLLNHLGNHIRGNATVSDNVEVGDCKQCSIWRTLDRKDAAGQVHPDFDAVVARILYGVEDGMHGNRQARFSGAPPLVLNNDALQGEFLLPLPKSAAKRLHVSDIPESACNRLRFKFGEVTAYFLGTGIGLLTFEIEFLPLLGSGKAKLIPSDVILEGLYAITHPADRGQDMLHGSVQALPAAVDVAEGDALVRVQIEDEGSGDKKGKKKTFVFAKATGSENDGVALNPAREGEACMVQRPGKLGAFQLPQLVDALLGHDENGNGRAADNAHKRLFSFGYLRVDELASEQDVRNLTFRIASKFNSEYAVKDSEVSRALVQTFDNVLHAMATQGGALVVRAGENGPEFLRTFLGKAAIPAYLPLAILSFHEYLHLKNLTQDNARLPDRDKPDEEVERMVELRNNLTDFRIFYRYSHVSMMSHHNVVHQAWRYALSLDGMLEELGRDVNEADKVLREAQEEKSEERWRWFGAFGAGAAGFIVTHELFEVALKLMHPEYRWLLLAWKGDGKTWAEIEHDPMFSAAVEAYHQFHHAEYWVLGLALVAAVAAGIVGWMKGPTLGE